MKKGGGEVFCGYKYLGDCPRLKEDVIGNAYRYNGVPIHAFQDYNPGTGVVVSVLTR